MSSAVAVLGAVGCFSASSNGSSDEAADTTTPTSDALNSTLVLDVGCTAAKVGPRQLLLAARCVSGNAAFTPGAVLTFKIAAGATGESPAVPDASAPDASSPDASGDDDGGSHADDASAPVDASTDDAGFHAKNTSATKATIASVAIHPSFVAACPTPDACAIGSVAAGAVKDIAVVTLSADLTAVPTIPVDLDYVGQSDPLLEVSAGCTTFDGTPGLVRTTPTIAVPTQVEKHSGSPFQTASASTLRAVAADYVITPAHGWNASSPGLCRGDLGAPLFRADKLAVAGITAGFTTYDPKNLVPVTLQHTRVDASSEVGTWLGTLGATTIRSCDGACASLGYDGGTPDMSLSTDDAGTSTTDEPTTLGPSPTPAHKTTPAASSSGNEVDLAEPSAQSGGCSTSGTGAGTNGFGLALGLGLALASLRRRR